MDHSRSKFVSNVIGNCPSCDGLVRVPPDAKMDASVRCPHCSQVFSISAVIDQIPELEVLDAASLPKRVPQIDRVLEVDELGDRKKFIVPTQLVKGSKRRRGGRHRESGDELSPRKPRPTYVVNAGAETRPNDSSDSFSATIEPDKMMEFSAVNSANGSNQRTRSTGTMQKVKVHSSQRLRRLKKIPKNSFVEVMKIVFGGLLAFPLAYLILLWIVGQDPLNIAPTLSRSVPFVIPKKMRVRPPIVEKPRLPRVNEVEQQPQPQLEPYPENEILNLPDVAPEIEKSN